MPPLGAERNEGHIWAGLQAGAVAFTATDSCICFQEGPISSYTKTQRAPGLRNLIYTRGSWVPPLGGLGDGHRGGPGPAGGGARGLLITSSPTGHGESLSSENRGKRREPVTPPRRGCNTVIYWRFTATQALTSQGEGQLGRKQGKRP